MFDRALAAADYLKAQGMTAEVGLILGSGLADCLTPENARTVDYHDIPFFPISTVPGHKSEWVSGALGGKSVAMMRGRFHLYEGFSGDEITFPIRVMKLLGVKTLIVTNAAGGVYTGFVPGDLMVIRDHINYSGLNPLIGPNDGRFGPRFPDMTEAYDGELASLAHKCGEEMGLELKDGTYMWFSGPSYETPAEIRMARILGADAIGMSTVPEVIAARHAGLKVLGISCITNMAAGISGTRLSHEEVVETGKRTQRSFAELIRRIMETM